MPVAKQRHGDIDPEFLEALDGPFSTSWDYFSELEPWGYTEADIEALWQAHGRSWLRHCRWEPEACPMDRPKALERWGEPPI